MREGAGSMNYYQVLCISPSSTQVDIDRAYQKLVKESRFDATMSRKDIETAYRILSDPTQKALYDAALATDGKKTTIRMKKQREPITMNKLIIVMLVLAVIGCIFFTYRYSYVLTSFSQGDVLVYKSTGKVIGTVVGEQSGHLFGKIAKDAYLIRTARGDVWLPKAQIKLSCRKK
jgi:hypothetical protein